MGSVVEWLIHLIPEIERAVRHTIGAARDALKEFAKGHAIFRAAMAADQ